MHEEALHKGYIQDIHVNQKLEHTYRTHQVDIVNQTEKTELQQSALERKNALVAAGQQQVEQHKARNAYIDVTTQQTQQQLKLNFQEQQAKSKIGQQKMQNVLASEAQSSKLAGQKHAQALKAAGDRSGHALKAREHKMKMEEARAKQKLRR
jgi:hypothetical protein